MAIGGDYKILNILVDGKRFEYKKDDDGENKELIELNGKLYDHVTFEDIADKYTLDLSVIPHCYHNISDKDKEKKDEKNAEYSKMDPFIIKCQGKLYSVIDGGYNYTREIHIEEAEYIDNIFTITEMCPCWQRYWYGC